MASYVRVTVLVWADILAGYAMWVMVTYLTNVWKLTLTHAAAIINVWIGVSMVMPVGNALLVDAFMGNYSMLLLSSVAYSIGLGLLSMSTPPVLSHATGTCSAYSPECIGHTQRTLFYTALALIAVGISGHTVSLKAFLNDQDQTENDESSQGKKHWQLVGLVAVILFPTIGVFVLPYINPWSVRFGIPAICTVVATILFVSGSCYYKYKRPQQSPLTSVFRVFVASGSKAFYRPPKNANKLYERHNEPDLEPVPHTPGLRCLDKAAIILPTQALDEQKKNRWRLCTVTEVEESKSSIRMIPICMTFIIRGVVSSIGNTYFLEQANHMNRRVGRLTVPLQIFLMFQDIAKSQFGNLYFCIADCLGPYAPPTGIAVALISSVLCCITAAKVETRRLDMIKSHGLLDKPDHRIPMSIFWLLPQFLLLGVLDGIAEKSIDKFFEGQAPPSMKNCLGLFSKGVLGLGIMGSVLTVYIAGKVSERGGKPSWFQDTLSKSRLDNYYWMLSAISAVNLLVYIVVAACYSYKKPELKNQQTTQNEETDESYDDTALCCCCG